MDRRKALFRCMQRYRADYACPARCEVHAWPTAHPGPCILGVAFARRESRRPHWRKL